MQKSFFLSVIMIFTCVFYFGITKAQVTPPLPSIPFKPIVSQTIVSQPMSGKIISLKATQIQTLESSGYICPVAGVTIEIKPYRGTKDTSFFIPTTAKKHTRYPLSIKQNILGKYTGTTNITCTHTATGVVSNVILKSITMYGTSLK